MATIGLVQINNSFSGQNYLPYSTACLESYLKLHSSKKDKLDFLPHIYKREPIQQIVDKLAGANIIGISTYVWNAQISLELARRIKSLNPETLVVFGGPQVPDKPEEFLRQNSFIDVVVHNEGEKTFTNLVDAWPENVWNNFTGISYIDPKSQFVGSVPTPRMRDLSELPSPFLNGVFDELVRNNPNEKWIGLWETNRGCPFQCTFCDWGSATAAKVTKFDDKRLDRELQWMADKKIEYIFVCDANFGIQKRDVDIAKSVARVKRETGFPQGFSVQNTKNATERAYLTQKIIADAGLNKGVALSMQSLDPITLDNIKRSNISLESYWELARRFTNDNVETYTDLILPLPGETYESFCNGVNSLIKAGQHNRIQFNNLSILPNAEMGDPEYLKRFGMKVIKSEIINVHGSRVELEDDVAEYQQLVVATDTMDFDHWKRARTFAWMASFLHFDKLFQIPIMISLEHSNLSFADIIDSFMDADSERHPTIHAMVNLFFDEAEKIGNGGAEYVYSKDWLEIYWPADEYMFIKLTVDKKIDDFYEEAEDILISLISNDFSGSVDGLKEAIALNRALISQPFLRETINFELDYNVLEFWKNIQQGKPCKLIKDPSCIEVSRNHQYYETLEDWCREVVWWGNKKGAYLYGVSSYDMTLMPEQLAGHF